MTITQFISKSPIFYFISYSYINCPINFALVTIYSAFKIILFFRMPSNGKSRDLRVIRKKRLFLGLQILFVVPKPTSLTDCLMIFEIQDPVPIL
jgi:hypothetical protein